MTAPDTKSTPFVSVNVSIVKVDISMHSLKTAFILLFVAIAAVFGKGAILSTYGKILKVG